MSSGRGRGLETLFRCVAVAFASKTPPPKASRSGASLPRLTLASPSTADGKHNLDLETKLPNLYTAAQRFPGPPPSPTPSRPPERKGTGEIAAGESNHPLVAPFNCSRDRDGRVKRDVDVRRKRKAASWDCWVETTVLLKQKAELSNNSPACRLVLMEKYQTLYVWHIGTP
jgi:hypothetical protein